MNQFLVKFKHWSIWSSIGGFSIIYFGNWKRQNCFFGSSFFVNIFEYITWQSACMHLQKKNQLNESYKIMLWKNSTITGTQNNSLSTSRTPLPFPILVSNWRKLSLADVYWFYPVLDWCKLVPRREVPEDDLTSLMSVNVEKAQHQNLTLAKRLPYAESHPNARKFHPRAQKTSNSLYRSNISPEQHHRVGPAIFLQPGDKPTGPGRHLHHCHHQQIIVVFSCLI